MERENNENIQTAKKWLSEVKPQQLGAWWSFWARDFTSNGQWEELYFHPAIGLIFAYRNSSNKLEIARISQDLKDLAGCRIFHTEKRSEKWIVK